MADHNGVELTPVQRRRLESSLEIHETPAERVAYQHSVLCQTCLPYRNPGDVVREWERQQGGVFLKVSAGEVLDPKRRAFQKVGLPFGSRPRLITAYVNAAAIRTGSPTVNVGDSLTAFVKRLLEYRTSSPDGRELRRFKEQLTRLAAANIRLAVASRQTAYQVETKIIDVMELWLEKDERQRVLWPAVVELSPRYFQTLTRHAVPLDERAIGALANSPMALDVYAWLAQRLHRIPTSKPQQISWQALYEQFGQGYARLRAFRENFLTVLADVTAQYPGANVVADKDAVELRHSPPPVLCRHSPLITSKPA
jgi:hypothetical protein